MAEADRVEHILENLYKAALGEVGLASAAASINQTIETAGQSLTFVEVDPGGEFEIQMSRFFEGAERRDDLQQLYFRDYYWRDEAIPRLAGLRDGELLYKSNLYSDQEMRTSAAYNEFRCVNNSENGLFIGIDGLDGLAIVWSFANPTSREGWGHDQIHAIRRLAPHIRQFARVRRALADARALGASLAELLENRRLGLIQLDRRARILEANDRAREILLKRDGLGDDKGVPAAECEQENVELRRLLSEALPPFGGPGIGGSMKVTRRKARSPLVLEVHPVRPMDTDRWAWRVRALVLIVDPAVRPRVEPDLVASVLGLTPAESRVAVAVANGQTVAGIAHALGCAESTVKTHLKRVYRKQGIRKQTELVQRILSLETLGGSAR